MLAEHFVGAMGWSERGEIRGSAQVLRGNVESVLAAKPILTRATLASLEIPVFVVANVGKPEEGKDRDGKHQ